MKNVLVFICLLLSLRCEAQYTVKYQTTKHVGVLHKDLKNPKYKIPWEYSKMSVTINRLSHTLIINGDREVLLEKEYDKGYDKNGWRIYDMNVIMRFAPTGAIRTGVLRFTHNEGNKAKITINWEDGIDEFYELVEQK